MHPSGTGRNRRRWGLSPPSSDIQQLDLRIRLFQNVVQSYLLRNVDPAVAVRVRPAAEQDWFGRLAILTGITSAARIDLGPSGSPAVEPNLVFDPTPERMGELYLTHRALRFGLQGAGGNAAENAVRELAVLAAIFRELRQAGLRPAYIRAAHHARVALLLGAAVLPDVSAS